MKNRHKVLIVEDEAPIRQMYQYKLQNSGYDVHTAKDGLEGLSLSQELRPDIVLLDIMMPEMSGDEMLTKMRETDWGAQIRIVILTNISKNEAPHSLRLLNVDRYVVKAHSTPSDIVSIVEDILGKQVAKIV